MVSLSERLRLYVNNGFSAREVLSLACIYIEVPSIIWEPAAASKCLNSVYACVCVYLYNSWTLFQLSTLIESSVW